VLIGELSRRSGVNPHQLRYYEAQGLLEPERGNSGYREYAEDALVTVAQIRAMLGAGLSTQEIAYLLPCAIGTIPEFAPCQELVDALRSRLQGLDDHIDTLVRSRAALHAYIDTTERQIA
jgi:DNA-binding transcriptional MerR regulator